VESAAAELIAAEPAATAKPAAAAELAESPTASTVESAKPRGLPGLAARALGRSQDALTSAAARVARLPGVDFLIQQAHANPALARVIGGIATLVVALLAGAALLGSPDQSEAEQPQLPYAIPAATPPTSPASGTTPSPVVPSAVSTANPSPTGSSETGNSSESRAAAPAAAPNHPGNGSGSGSSDNEPGRTSPNPTETSSATPTQTSTSPPPPPCATGCPIAFDATELSYPTFKIPGVTDDWVDTGGVQTLRLTPLRSTVAGRSRHGDHVNVQLMGLAASGIGQTA
jgi:hypothetical protein